MSSINQIISEIAHSVQQPNSLPARRIIRGSIVHARNRLIRQSYSNHNYLDKGLQQRFRVSLIDIPDGDLYNSQGIIPDTIKRTKIKVPRPTRLTNNLPFQSVRTVGLRNPIEIAFVREASMKFYSSLPGANCIPTYDYINDYLYIDFSNTPQLHNIGGIIIESVFEYPEIVPTENIDTEDFSKLYSDDDEYFVPEDMVDEIKQIVLATFNVQFIRETNEVTNPNKSS